jgi:hypothetical protein
MGQMRVNPELLPANTYGVIYVGESIILKGKREFHPEDNIKMDLRREV